MIDTTSFEYTDNAYGQNIRGFPAFVPDPFGCNPAQMEQYYDEMYVYGPNPRFPISQATIAGAAAYKAVQESSTKIPALPNNQHFPLHSEVISFVRAVAAREAQFLLQRYPLPGVDPEMVILSAEEGAHRLYHHATNFD